MGPKPVITARELKLQALTREVFDEVNLASLTRHGGQLSDLKQFPRPFTLRYPNPWEQRDVHVRISNFAGYPHYVARVEEEANMFVARDDDGKLMWASPWRDMDDPVYAAFYRKHGDLLQRTFDSGERNTIGAADRWS